jgi:CRP-like cAMP-binding protein
MDSRPPLTGIWLTPEPAPLPIQSLLLEMLLPSLPNPILRDAELEELERGAKLSRVVLEYLGLRTIAVDEAGPTPLHVVRAKLARDPWRDALVMPDGDRPIALLVNTADAGPLVLVHEVFTRFGDAEKDLIRRYAALAARGESHDRIVATLGAGRGDAFLRTLNAARRHVQSLDPTVLFSPDGATRVQLGSLSRTTKDILREGIDGDHLFILPASFFEDRTNYADIEFLVYLNFFLRQKARTRVAGTARQRQLLHRLLTLTLFGLFDPAAPAPPPFETLRVRYGVESRETYEFLLTAHEMYGTRRDSGIGSPLLGIDDYVDFVTLEGETMIALSSADVRVTPRGRAFDVRIVQADGRQSEKRLEVGAPRRRVRPIPAALRATIQFATERPRLGLTPLGTSHGFDAAGDFTSFIIWINSKGVLVDPSLEALVYLEEIGIAPLDVPYVFLTHIHADHDGGLIEKLLSGSQTTVIASDPVFRTFVEKAQLVTGHDFEREGLVKHIPANPSGAVQLEVAGEPAEIRTRWNLHPIPTNGFRISFDGRSFGYSGDTEYDPARIAALRDKLPASHVEALLHFFWTPDGAPTVDLLYHEAGIPPIHTDKEKLRGLPARVLERTKLVHIADVDVPTAFTPAKPRLFETQVLLPATPHSRDRILLETLRLVAYLYDMPSETLEALLAAGQLVTHAVEDVIVRKGPVGKGEALFFHVVTDGAVSVRDGRRIIARLVKADTFGEWGISHQRGFRVADVVADRPSQTLRVGEETYRWLVDRHPTIQDRLSKIRSLLPRLQLAQDRARLKAEVAPGSRSVLENMSAGQLSSLAIFSETKTFRQGHHILAKGAQADGFYILLSGHLGAEVDGRIVGELSEGDVFGELGLLEGGRREADVRVVSADADVLFMSAKNFQRLLQTAPGFAWGVREAAAGRRESNRRSPGD